MINKELCSQFACLIIFTCWEAEIDRLVEGTHIIDLLYDFSTIYFFIDSTTRRASDFCSSIDLMLWKLYLWLEIGHRQTK